MTEMSAAAADIMYVAGADIQPGDTASVNVAIYTVTVESVTESADEARQVLSGVDQDGHEVTVTVRDEASIRVSRPVPEEPTP